MRLVQLQTAAGSRHVGLVEGDEVEILVGVASTRELALEAIGQGRDLATQAGYYARGERLNYRQLLDEQRILSPLDHPDSAHVLVTGTGLTHLGSAATRDKMHQQAHDEAAVTDSMKVFKWAWRAASRRPGRLGCNRSGFTRATAASWCAPARPCPCRLLPRMPVRSQSWQGYT